MTITTRHKTKATLGVLIPVRLALALACCTVSQHALAQAGTAPSESPSVAGDDSEALRAGIAAYKKRDYAAARESLARAWELGHLVTVAGMLAETEMKLERYSDAAKHWTEYQRMLPQESESERQEATKQLALCREHVGLVALVVDPVDAAVLVDGTEIPGKRDTARREVWMVPGEHTFQGTANGRLSPVKTLKIESGDELQLDLAVPSAEPTPVAAQRRLTPPAFAPVPADTQPGAKRSSTARTAVLITESALTVVALGIGAGAWISYKSAESDAAHLGEEVDRAGPDPNHGACLPSNPSRPAACDPLAERNADRISAAKIVNAAFPVAGILGAITVGTYLLWPKTEQPLKSQGNLTITPYWSSANQGITVHSSF